MPIITMTSIFFTLLPFSLHMFCMTNCCDTSPISCLPTMGGGGLAQGLGIRLFAFGGAYWPLATAHSDPLWAQMCFGCVKQNGQQP